MNAFAIEQLQFAYASDGRPDGNLVIRRLDLSIESGHITAILGPNGAGKTTLLNLCLGWLKPAAGSITLFDRNLSAYSRRELGRTVSLVPQSEYIPFEYSLLEYVLLGRAPYLTPLQSPGENDVQLANEALDRVGLPGRHDSSILATSAGEKQLVMLARSLAQQPTVLLLDEPSAHLDLKNKRRLIELLSAQVDRGVTVVLTAHEPEFAAAVASRVVLLKGGSVLEDGPVNHVMTSERLTHTYDTTISVHETGDRLSFHW